MLRLTFLAMCVVVSGYAQTLKEDDEKTIDLLVKAKLSETAKEYCGNSTSVNHEACIRIVEEQLRNFYTEELNKADPCTSPSTIGLVGAWRKDYKGSNIKPYNGQYACDFELQQGQTWFRFTGDGGHQLANRCRPDLSCGAHGGFWSDDEMPRKVGEIKQVPIYGSLRNNCDWYQWSVTKPLTVKRCSERPGDFVYKVQGSPAACQWAFCGMDVPMDL